MLPKVQTFMLFRNLIRLFHTAGESSACLRGCAPGIYFALCLISPGASAAMTYYVAPYGSDTGTGTDDRPWATIRRGVEAAMPGDTLVVREGNYEERVTTVREGRVDACIGLAAQGQVVMRGFNILHSYITISGFRIVGHSGDTILDAQVRVSRAGDHFRMSGCTITGDIELVRKDFMFEASTRRILSETGGFVEAGFAPGQFVSITPTSRGIDFGNSNSKRLRVVEVTDRSLTVTNVVTDIGPLSGHLTACPQYALYFENGSEGGRVKNCTFTNLGYDAWFIFGTNHVLESNVIEAVKGWDAMHFGGFGHLFRLNIIRDSPQVVYQTSPDAIENYSPNPYDRVVFKQNIIQGFEGVIAAQKGGSHSSNLFLLRNVIVDAGWLSLSHPYTRIENNTFLRCAKFANATVSVARHPVILQVPPVPGLGLPDARESVLRNNAFVDCGQATGPVPESQVGWYEVKGPGETIVTEGNFVTGAPPLFGVKNGWPESPTLNGGDPGFLDSRSIVGPDELPFTDDDGLRPSPGSLLRSSGVAGRTVGAYETGVVQSPPPLRFDRTADGALLLSWPRDLSDSTLEVALSPFGPWDSYPHWPDGPDGHITVLIRPTARMLFFRLAR